MRNSRFTESQIVSILNEAEAGIQVKEVCRKNGISSPTFYKWKARYGLTIAPSTIIQAAAPVLHHYIDGDFLSGSNPWPADVEDKRIDKESGLSWDELKKSMMGSRTWFHASHHGCPDLGQALMNPGVFQTIYAQALTDGG